MKELWIDAFLLSRLRRRLELLRGRLLRLRGARVGVRFGLGPGLVVEYPACLRAGDAVTLEGPGYLHCLSERGVRIGSNTSIARNVWLHCGGTPEQHDHGYDPEHAHGSDRTRGLQRRFRV